MQGDEVVGHGAEGGADERGRRWGLTERRAALEGVRVALAGLDGVLFEASGAELGPLLGLVDDVVAAAELGRVVVTGEALARGEIGVRGGRR